MTTLRQIATLAFVASIFACSNAQADTPAKITLVDGQTIEASISERSNDESVYVVFSGNSTKVVRKIARTQIATIQQLEVAPLASNVQSSKTVAELALDALRHPNVTAVATK